MFLVSQTRCGISAKQLERELGVTYKTAWRILNKVRNQLMDEMDGEPLSGEVEVDETAIGGKPRASDGPMTRREAVIWAKEKKTTVVGMVERRGRIRATLAENREQLPVRSIVEQHVLPSSIVFTDEWVGYRKLDQHFAAHRRIRHAEKIYVEGDVYTNTIEGFFGNLKRGIAGTYHAVSKKWLQGYLNEYTWRYNRRDDDRAMFLSLIDRAAA
jgi:transposase-like protein